MIRLSTTVGSLLALSLVACTGDDLSSSNDGGAGADATHNPPNPSGLGPAPVDLGSSTDLTGTGAYVVLAKTGVTNVTGSSITGGHVGLSPAAATFMTGFGMTADASNMFATSPSVVAPGKLYASTYAVPTPTNLTTAVLAMQAAYSDAASRTNPDALNLASGNLGGQTLTPGLYTWGTGVTIANDITIAGGATDVWILQVKGNLELATAKSVILAGGAQAKNITWQVTGEVTLHATSHFEGVILGKTGITLQTMATLHGRALAQSLVALDNNAVTAP
jgi:hypothetical protein